MEDTKVPLRRTTNRKIIVKRKVRRSPRGKTKRYSLDYERIYKDKEETR